MKRKNREKINFLIQKGQNKLDVLRVFNPEILVFYRQFIVFYRVLSIIIVLCRAFVVLLSIVVKEKINGFIWWCRKKIRCL